MRGTQFGAPNITEAIIQEQKYQRHKKKLSTIQPASTFENMDEIIEKTRNKFTTSKRFRNQEMWRSNDIQHARIISKFNEISKGK